MMARLVSTAIAVLQPWHDAYSGSTWIATAVTSTHLGAMLLGGGLAVTVDRATLRTARGSADERARMIAELHSSHRGVLAALVFLFASGVLLATADLETFLVSPAFWIKLGLVALLLANGALLAATERTLGRETTEEREARLWARLRMSARASLLLWLATLVAGVALVNAA